MKSLCVLLIVLQVFPAYALQSVIEIGHIGKISNESKERLALFERDLQRLIENTPAFQAKVQLGNKHFTESEYQAFLDAETLKSYTRDLRKGPLSTLELGNLRKLQAKMDRLGTEGAILQESLLAEAYLLWKSGDQKNSTKLMTKALSLHPEGLGDFMSDWFDLEGASAVTTSFGVALEAKRMKILRGCEVHVNNFPSTQSLYANGFWLQPQKSYHFQTGRIYRISAGPDYEPALLSCTKTGSQQISVPSERLVQRNIATSLTGAKVTLFVREKKGTLLVDSFSAGKKVMISQFAEVEKTGKVKVVAEEGLEEFGKYHRLTPMDLAITQLRRVSTHPEPSAGGLAESVARPWYQSWVFWTITGAVAAGAATYLLTRGSGEATIGTNSTGIKISVE